MLVYRESTRTYGGAVFVVEDLGGPHASVPLCYGMCMCIA